MKVEIDGIVYTVEAKGRAQAVRRAAELATKSPVGSAKIPTFRGFIPYGVVYTVEVNGVTMSAIVRNGGE
jgi:hypothetical protein